LLGYGTIAEEHAAALTRLGCTLAVVAGPRPEAVEAFASTHGVERWTTNVDAATAASDVDAVVVASPNALHAEQITAALAAGKHALCEVPLALSLAEAEQLASLAAAAPGRTMVCQTQRFLEPVQTLRGWTAGRQIHQVVIRLVVNRTSNVGITGRRRSWVDNLVWHHGSHAVDTALWLLHEEIVDVVARGVGESANGTPMDAGVLLTTASGALATIALSYRAEAPSTDFLVMCEGATYAYAGGVLSASDGTSLEFNEAAMFADAVHAQDAVFVEGVVNGGTISPTIADVGQLYRVLDRISAQTSSET
jgi:2-hydroxy-4-carboxymuconate semialdehyde hemiacetal dehydrogenase